MLSALMPDHDQAGAVWLEGEDRPLLWHVHCDRLPIVCADVRHRCSDVRDEGHRFAREIEERDQALSARAPNGVRGVGLRRLSI